MKKKISVCLALSAALFCTPVFAESVSVPEETAAYEEDTQNPVMNYVGEYVAGRGIMKIECEGDSEGKVFVSWCSSAWEHSEWEMSGPFDSESKTLTYENCVKRDIAFNDDGETETETVAYENGTGRITFTDADGVGLIWYDDQTEAESKEGIEMEFLSPSGIMAVQEDLPESLAEVLDDPSAVAVSSSTELNNGVLTVYLTGNEKEGFHWEYLSDTADDDDHVVELLTDSDMEDGYLYVGSFRAIQDGKTSIRVIHTNGEYIDEYMDFDVTAENGEITGHSGGGCTYAPTAEDLAPVLEGTWEEKDTKMFLTFELSGDGGLNAVISDGTGKDGEVALTTMTVYYDALYNNMVYNNGTSVQAEITADSDAEALTDAAAENGTGAFIINTNNVDPETFEGMTIIWRNDVTGEVHEFEQAAE